MSNEINNLQSVICKPSYPQKIVLKFRMGGEGVVLVCDCCGSIRPSEKAKIGKGAKPPPSHYEKKVLVAGFEPATRLLCFVATLHSIDRNLPMTLPTELHQHGW
jgi:hypothetical protein